jgi:hypothetical protein
VINHRRKTLIVAQAIDHGIYLMIERFSKVFAAALRGRIEIKLPANFGEKLTLSIL